eukprot:g8592.t1
MVDYVHASPDSVWASLQAARPHLAAGAVARFVSISAVYPLDTIKTRLHLGRALGVPPLPDMYRGLASSLVGQVPYGMLTFGTYEIYKAALLKRFPDIPHAVTFCAAAVLGDMTGSLWLVPSEVVKVQMQGGVHASVSKATLSIFRKGGLAGFYQGFSGQLGRDVPFRAIQLTSYELLRKMLGSWRKRQQDAAALAAGGEPRSRAAVGADAGDGKFQLSSGDAALVGGVAGAISASITCPLDVLRTRLMVGGRGGGGAATWTSAIKAGNLFAGLGTRVLYVGTSSAVFFVVYEAVKTHLGVAASPPPARTVGKEKREQ